MGWFFADTLSKSWYFLKLQARIHGRIKRVSAGAHFHVEGGRVELCSVSIILDTRGHIYWQRKMVRENGSKHVLSMWNVIQNFLGMQSWDAFNYIIRSVFWSRAHQYAWDFPCALIVGRQLVKAENQLWALGILLRDLSLKSWHGKMRTVTFIATGSIDTLSLLIPH